MDTCCCYDSYIPLTITACNHQYTVIVLVYDHTKVWCDCDTMECNEQLTCCDKE